MNNQQAALTWSTFILEGMSAGAKLCLSGAAKTSRETDKKRLETFVCSALRQK